MQVVVYYITDVMSDMNRRGAVMAKFRECEIRRWQICEKKNRLQFFGSIIEELVIMEGILNNHYLKNECIKI
jgi:hypothetical protein